MLNTPISGPYQLNQANLSIKSLAIIIALLNKFNNQFICKMQLFILDHYN